MTREEALERRDRIRYNLLNSDDKAAVDVAFDVLQDCSPWIRVEDSMPQEFVSVLGYMTDASPFPPVRECYRVGKVFFFPALRDIHPVSHWMPMPTKEEST